MAEDFVFGDGQDGGKAEGQAGSGATDIFGVIAPAARDEPQAREPEGRAAPPKVHSVVFKSDASRVEETDQLLNLLRAPVGAAPVVPAQPIVSPVSGGFTQLLRALNYEPVKEAAPSVEAAAVRVQPEAVPVAPAAEAKPVATPRVTSFQPPAAPPLMAAPVMEQRAEPAPGSFTQLFRALEAGPEVAKTERVEEIPAAAESPAAVADAGLFTRMLSAPVVAPGEQAKVEPPVAASQEPGSFTRMFEAVSEAPVVTAPPAAVVSPAAGGSFTQVFRAVEAAPEVAQAGANPTEASAAPGSFTQMFSTPAIVPVEAARVEPPVSLAASSPGLFTQMFQAVSEPPKEMPSSAPSAARPGSFTQMFRALDAAPVPAPSSGQASPAFGTHRSEAEPVRAAAPVFPSVPTPSVPQAPVASSSGLTQLLRALDQPGQQVAQPYAPSAAAAAPAQQPGSFTSVYGKLDTNVAAPPVPAPPVPAPMQAVSAPAPIARRDATQAFHLAQASAVSQVAAPVQAGPSEFTRILNASMVREAALRGAGPETAAATAPTPSAPSGLPAFGVMPAAPKMPEPPKVKLPEPPKVAAMGGMQQYIPLLLILVIFLLLAILVAVVFLMKK